MEDATELARRIRAGELTAVEATRDAIDRIERLNPLVNAVVTPLFDDAIAQARSADRRGRSGDWAGPLHGVPVLMKDLFDYKAGVRTSFGCRATQDFVPTESSVAIRRLEAAGAIVLGKTNTPEFGHKGITDNTLFGPTSTPFDLSRNAGGSSGGSAAAVAAGMTPVAQGSDAGGSVRIPAAWCGVVGFKPTYGRVPNSNSSNAFAGNAPYVHVGTLSATVRDAALMANVMSGPDLCDPDCFPAAGDLGPPDVDMSRRVRVAYSADMGVFAVDKPVAQTVRECVDALERSGMRVDVVDWRLPLGQDELASLWIRQVGLLYLEMFDAFASSGSDLLRDSAADIPAPIHRMVEQARRMSAMDARRDNQLRTLVWQSVQQVLEEHDVLVTPTLSALPEVNSDDGRTLGPESVDGHAVERLIGWCLTHPFNFTGHPAASAPAGLSECGLPVGMQVVGRKFEDQTVLDVCGAIESTRPWCGELSDMRRRLAETPPQQGQTGQET